MLRSPEYTDIREDYDRISRERFARDYSPPQGLSFARSDALFPTGELADTIAAEYERQCRAPCFGPFPRWPQVQSRFEELRTCL